MKTFLSSSKAYNAKYSCSGNRWNHSNISYNYQQALELHKKCQKYCILMVMDFIILLSVGSQFWTAYEQKHSAISVSKCPTRLTKKNYMYKHTSMDII